MTKQKKKVASKRGIVDAPIERSGETKEWDAIPLHIMQTLKMDRLPHLKRIHQSIAKSAKLTMPPVFIAPYGWVWPDMEGAIYGKTGPVNLGDHYEFAVELPITTLLYADDLLLRRILVHEFAHYFHRIERLVKIGNSNKNESTQREVSDTTAEWIQKLIEGEDERLKADLSDWLSENDAKLDIDYDDPAFDSFDLRLVRNWVNEELPTCTPEIVFDNVECRLRVSSDIYQRAKMLKQKE